MSEMTVEERDAAQAKEYGRYVATEPIDLGGARAFNVGDPVPIQHVEGGERDKVEDDGDGNRVVTGKEKFPGVVREDQVAKRTTKAAKAAITKES